MPPMSTLMQIYWNLHKIPIVAPSKAICIPLQCDGGCTHEGRNERDFDSSGLSDEELVAALAPYQTEIREELRRERENYDQYLMQERDS